MRILKSLSFALLLSGAMISSSAIAVNPAAVILYNETPAKTIVIKNMAAEDVNKFFTTNTVFSFEVFKAGTKAEISALIADLQKNSGVESMNMGVTTGDYQAFTLVLKSAQTKQWFIDAFKKAGLNHIKINRRDVTEIEKM